jgi:hypothetical protein
MTWSRKFSCFAPLGATSSSVNRNLQPSLPAWPWEHCRCVAELEWRISRRRRWSFVLRKAVYETGMRVNCSRSIIQLCQFPGFKALWPGIRCFTNSRCQACFQSLTAAAMPFGKPHCSVFLIALPTFYPRESRPLLNRPPLQNGVVAHFACRPFSTAVKQSAGCAPFAIEDAAGFVLKLTAKLLFAVPILALPCTNL